MVKRIFASARGRLRSARTHPALNRTARLERRIESEVGHPVVESHGPHLTAALDWLVRAQDATPDGGFSRGASIAWNRYFGSRGWQPSYPETTGYIIPTFYMAASHLDREDLPERATRAADWESDIQLESGAVRGGVIGQNVSPSVFNTGQVIFGWLAAFSETGEGRFADSAASAGRYLVDVLEADGHWRKGNSKFARSDTTIYNTRTAWALAEAGLALDRSDFIDAAASNLLAAVGVQHENGWIPSCCLSDPDRPLLHTVAYAIRGLLEGGRVLDDAQILDAARIPAEALMAQVRSDGWMAGRFDSNWAPAVDWACLTGMAQMANNWLRLHAISGDSRWLEQVPSVLRFLKKTQNRASLDPALRGAVKGSFPFDGGYGRFEVLNWATKFFVDALIRHERAQSGGSRPGGLAATDVLA